MQYVNTTNETDQNERENRTNESPVLIFSKGAPEEILDISTKIFIDQNHNF